MKVVTHVEDRSTKDEHATDSAPFDPLVLGRAMRNGASLVEGVVVGELVGMTVDERTPLVIYSGQMGSAAIAARSVVDVHGAHIGRRVVLVFEGGDSSKPIILGVVRDEHGSSLDARSGTIDVDSDGERLVVSARTQLVLRCGKASITLTKTGKILIQGTYVSNRSSGVMRIKGGSVQLN